jgi:hypothetical protein
MLFRSDDLPTFERPETAISGSGRRGQSGRFPALFTNSTERIFKVFPSPKRSADATREEGAQGRSPGTTRDAGLDAG